MKILVTGSSGMLGRAFLAALSSESTDLVGVDIAEPAVRDASPSPLRFADICGIKAVTSIFSEEKPDVVIHAAAWTDVDGCEKDPVKARKINVGGTVNVAEACKKGSIPLVFISTDFVFDGRKNTPYVENDECSPLGVYGTTKWEGEKAVKETLENFAIVRTSWLFGPGGKNFVDTIMSKTPEESPLKVVDDQIGSPTYTKDLAAAIQRFIDGGIKGGGIYHVCNSGQCSWYEFAVKIKELAPGMKDVGIEPISSESLARPADRPSFSVMDTGKFRAHTGTSLRDWTDALREYMSTG